MPTPLYLNERSCGFGAPSADEALSIALNFVATVRGAQKHATAVLFLDRTLKDVQIGTGHTLAQVLTAESGDIESWRYLRALDNRAPFRLSAAGESLPEDVDYTYGGGSAVGLGYAHAAKGVALSFLSSSCWDCSSVVLQRVTIERDEITENDVSVRHASRVDHLVAALQGVRRDQLSGQTVAIYSLDPGLNSDVRDLLMATFEGIDVKCREDKTGGTSLEQLARSADIFVVVTQKATHAASNVIVDERTNAGKRIVYPNRATVKGVLEAITLEVDKRRGRLDPTDPVPST